MSATLDYREVLARLDKAVETSDWCELEPGEAFVLREHIRWLADEVRRLRGGGSPSGKERP